MTTRRPQVLIVDDEKAIRDLVSEVLNDRGYICYTAADADEALAKLQEHSFDIALLDILMPGISGLELLVAIVQRYKTTSVIMVSAITDANTALKAMKQGAVDYIFKPFTLNELRTRVGAVLKNKVHESIGNDVQIQTTQCSLGWA